MDDIFYYILFGLFFFPAIVAFKEWIQNIKSINQALVDILIFLALPLLLFLALGFSMLFLVIACCLGLTLLHVTFPAFLGLKELWNKIKSIRKN